MYICTQTCVFVYTCVCVCVCTVCVCVYAHTHTHTHAHMHTHTHTHTPADTPLSSIPAVQLRATALSFLKYFDACNCCGRCGGSASAADLRAALPRRYQPVPLGTTRRLRLLRHKLQSHVNLAQMQPARRVPRIASRATTAQRSALRKCNQREPRKCNQRALRKCNQPVEVRASHPVQRQRSAAQRANATSPQRSAHRIPCNDRAAQRTLLLFVLVRAIACNCCGRCGGSASAAALLRHKLL